MRIVTLKPTELISSNVPEDQYKGAPTADGKWTTGIPYAVDAIVYYAEATPHRVYKSVDVDNTTTPGTNIAKWTDLGATDRWMMFDPKINAQSTFDTASIDVSGCDCVGIFNCEATIVTFTLTVDSVVIKTESINMDVSGVADFDEWIFWPIEYRKLLLWDFPQYYGAVLTVTAQYLDNGAKCGLLAAGKAYFLGNTTKSIDTETNDYSYVDEDAVTGALSLIPGNHSKGGAIKIWLKDRMVDIAERRVLENLGKVAIYDFNNGRLVHESLVFCGISKKTRKTIKMYDETKMTFSMRGVI